MHISEGVLSLPVLGAGAAIACAGLAVALKRLPWRHIMSVGILSAAFFVASLIHIPLGPGSAHLIMNGLVGAILGLAALPAIAVALFLQSLLFQYGGLSALGVNICLMGLPAVLCGLVFRPFFQPRAKAIIRNLAAFACGALAVLLSALLCALALALSGEAFFTTAWTIFIAHIPIMLVEGLLTCLVTAFLIKTLPEIFRPEPLP